LCGMRYLAPFVVHGTLGMTREQADRHASDWRRTIEALRDDRVDLDRAVAAARLNADFDALLRD
ncbi:MAG: flavodoxin family protein, partial [marine benthic group bacterium]|nr:flavodoxin family protein [Gemmatimonadota bacterium]